MKRTALIGLVAAAALAVAACGSNSAGTPTAATTVAGATTAAATSSEAPTSEAPPAETSSESMDTSASADTATESADTGSETAGGDTDTSEAPTTTLGGVVDENTTTWFTTFCTDLAPAMTGLESTMSSAMGDSSDPKKAQQTVADAFDKAGQAFTKTGQDLSALPPPSIDRGAEVSAKIIGAMAAAGTAFSGAAQKVSAATVSSAADLTKVLEEASTEAQSALSGLDMGNLELSKDLQAQLKEIPACKTAFGDN